MKIKLVTIKQIMEQFNLTKYMIYQAIKHDPSFPCVNLGPVKNYRIDLYRFEEWFNRRILTTNFSVEIPTSKELLEYNCGN